MLLQLCSFTSLWLWQIPLTSIIQQFSALVIQTLTQVRVLQRSAINSPHLMDKITSKLRQEDSVMVVSYLTS
jgi:hypothetical protein